MLGFNAARQQSLLRPIGIDEAQAWQLVTAFGVGSALALGLTLWFLLRQHRDRSPPLVQAWRALARRLRRSGWIKEPSEPPLSFAQRVAANLSGNGQDLISVSQRYCDWRYAGYVLTDEEQTALIRGLRGFRITQRNRP